MGDISDGDALPNFNFSTNRDYQDDRNDDRNDITYRNPDTHDHFYPLADCHKYATGDTDKYANPQRHASGDNYADRPLPSTAAA